MIIEEDHDSGTYQVLSYGGPATKSNLTLSEWRAVDWIPDRFIDSFEAKAPNSEVSLFDQQKPTVKSGVKRLGAWVKRSGRELIVRLHKLSQDKTFSHDIGEVYLDGYETPELAGSPILELPRANSLTIDLPREYNALASRRNSLSSRGGSFQELPDTPARSELPDSPVPSELPTVTDLYDMETDN